VVGRLRLAAEWWDDVVWRPAPPSACSATQSTPASTPQTQAHRQALLDDLGFEGDFWRLP
jgi:hypothetical protein